MADTIQLKLLENKSIVAEINGRNYAYEGGYNIVAGDENATEFEITSIPTKYEDFTFSVSMTNSRGQQVNASEIVDNKFALPVGMAVAGYGQIVISAHGINESGDSVTANFLPFKIKVANTKANWTSGVISGTISIGKVETLPPQGKAYAVNVGTANDARINFGIPQGEKGEDALPISILGETYYDPALSYAWSTAELLPLPTFSETKEGTAYLVDDNEVKGQYDLYIHNYEAFDWVIINNWGGIPGKQGKTGPMGPQGVGILSITANGTDANGGNVYKITLTNNETYNFTAPQGPQGEPGGGADVNDVIWGVDIASSSNTYEGSFDDEFLTRHGYMGSIQAPQTPDWYNLINIRHRNGQGDGNAYGLQIRQAMTVMGAPIEYRMQVGGEWGGWQQFYSTENKPSAADIGAVPAMGGAMTGPLNLANGTWNAAGDDALFGDYNHDGAFCIKGVNGATALCLVQQANDNNSANIIYDGSHLFADHVFAANAFEQPDPNKDYVDFVGGTGVAFGVRGGSGQIYNLTEMRDNPNVYSITSMQSGYTAVAFKNGLKIVAITTSVGSAQSGAMNYTFNLPMHFSFQYPPTISVTPKNVNSTGSFIGLGISNITTTGFSLSWYGNSGNDLVNGLLIIAIGQ